MYADNLAKSASGKASSKLIGSGVLYNHHRTLPTNTCCVRYDCTVDTLDAHLLCVLSFVRANMAM